MKISIKIASLVVLGLFLMTCSVFRPKIMVPDMDPGFCMNCHQQVTPGLFQSWVESKHAKKGVHCMTCHIDHEYASKQKSMVFPEKCGECHKKELAEFRHHDEAKAKKSAVEPKACGECHKEKYAQFLQSRHSDSWAKMKEHPQYRALPIQLRKAFCERCHNVQHRCNSCHTSHAFSPKEAREPEACKKCHTGLAGPHDEMYASSLHGTVYAADKSTIRAPNCVTCHMHKGTHNVSFGVVYDSWGNPVNRQGEPLSKEQQEEIRKEMIKGVCFQCHIKSLTLERYELADQVKKRARETLDEAEGVIRELERDGILPKGIVLGKGQLYQDASRIEALYFRMSQFQNIYTWKGAYHFSADFAHWYGWAHLQMSLIEIKEEARKLRELKKSKK